MRYLLQITGWYVTKTLFCTIVTHISHISMLYAYLLPFFSWAFLNTLIMGGICHLTQKSHNWQNRDGNVQNCYILSFHCLLTPVVTIYPIHTIYNHPNFICVKYELPTRFLWQDIPENAFFAFFCLSRFERRFLNAFICHRYSDTWIWRRYSDTSMSSL